MSSSSTEIEPRDKVDAGVATVGCRCRGGESGGGPGDCCDIVAVVEVGVVVVVTETAAVEVRDE